MLYRFVNTGIPVILISIMCFAGCGGITARGRHATNGLPVSNTVIIEKAVLEALETAGLPDGMNESVRLEYRGEDSAKKLCMVLVPGFLENIGYRVLESNESATVLVVRIHTMAVFLNVDRTLFHRDTVFRRADVSLSLEKRGKNSVKSVYQGSSSTSDEFPAAFLTAAGNDKTYVTVNDTGAFFTGDHGKTLVLGITMTALAWLLYVYRG